MEHHRLSSEEESPIPNEPESPYDILTPSRYRTIRHNVSLFRSSRYLCLLSTLLIFSTLLLFTTYDYQRLLREIESHRSPYSSFTPDSSNTIPCSLPASIIRTLDITTPFEFTRLEIHTRFQPPTSTNNPPPPPPPPPPATIPPTFTALNTTFPPFQEIPPIPDTTTTILEIGLAPSTCTNLLTLDVPAPPTHPADLSHVVFGVATTLTRLEATLEHMAHWAGGTGALVVVVIPEVYVAGAVEGVVRRAAREWGFRLVVEEDAGEEEGGVKGHEDEYLSLLRALWRNRRKGGRGRGRGRGTQWGVILDDDTFFLSAARLEKWLDGWDARYPWYIGTVTEDTGNLNAFGQFAYGGGGVFMSMPLLEVLAKEEVFQECLARKAIGDRQVADCIYYHSLTKLTTDARLHQIDLSGDVSGFYESGRELPLSVHHWKSWYKLNVTGMSAVQEVCGDECLLRRWRFEDPKGGRGWFLTNGYSIVRYSEGHEIQEGDLTMERTWDNGIDYRHSLEPLREKDIGKMQYKMEGAWREDDGATLRQFYVLRKEAQDQSAGEVHDKVVEVIWRKGKKD